MQGPPFELRRGRGLNNRATGDLGEDIASRYLAQRGYEVVERNYRTRRGELDLISRSGDTLVIVEVKLRRTTAYGDPLEAVTPRKRQAIRLMAEEYLSERDPDFQDLRFDVIGILLRAGRPEISHVEGAF
ncbi:MAG TPA: YraN family protein [Rubrobacter sp.]|nr:YraN family protein [Rubrobacter sp.]